HQWKPTVLYWLFAAMLVLAAVAFRKNLIRSMMGSQVTLPERVWRQLLSAWIGFFTLMGVLNLYVAYRYSLDFWVNFKLFGSLGLMLVFILAQGLLLARHLLGSNERA